LTARDIETIFRLAPMQEGMLFHSLSDPELGLYVEQAACTLEGELDPARLRAAWERVVAHHPALRASFHWREVATPVQVVHRRVQVPWREEDWRAVGEPSRLDARLRALVEAERRRGFDLERAPLLRLTLVRTAERRWRFLWSYHHLLLDGWSLAPLLGQVFDAYGALAEGREPALPPARPYVDYIAWLEARDTAAEHERDEAFWRRTLAGFRAATPLPGALRGGAGAREARGALGVRPATASRSRPLPRAETAAVGALARAAGVTPGTAVQAAWALLLGRSAGEDDVVFGTVVSGRPAHLPGADSMVGLFINTLPVRVRLAEDEPLVPWLRRLQERLVELREHEHSPLARVHRWSDVAPGEPLFESLIAFENYPRDPGVFQRVGGLAVRDLASFDQTNYPLNVAVVPGEELLLEVTYAPESFEPGAPERLLDRVAALLSAMAAAPEGRVGDLPVMTPEEERRILLEWSGASLPVAAGAPEATGAPEAGGAAETLHDLVAEQVRRSPEAVAVVPSDGGEPWSYGELWAASTAVVAALAHLLTTTRGAESGERTREQFLAVFLDRSPWAYAAILGVLRAGAAYLPLDPDLPDRRVLDVLRDAGSPVVVTRRQLWRRLAAGAPVPAGLTPLLVEELEPTAPGPPPELGPEVPPDRAAYAVYTSGSTGRPKGVVVGHRSVVNFLRAARERLGTGPRTRVVQLSSLGFDASVAEIFLALASGGRVCPVDRETLLSPAALAGALARSGANVIMAAPVLLEALPPEDYPELEQIFSGADRCPPQVAARWSAGRRFSNDYGPTEATIYCLIHTGPGGPQGPPLGRPIAGARVYVLDRRLRPVPSGAPGEILLGGLPLARGYLDRPGLTAERFIPHPFAGLDGRRGERLYRSGDLGRFLPDGSVEFVGRIDHQVKIRGHRVECGEVETVLRDHSSVAACAVVAQGEAPHRRLAAFVVPRPGAPRPDPEELRGWLALRLPEPMVPAVFEALTELPLGATGKVDRRALERRPAGSPDRAGSRPPAPGPEAVLARIWGEVLGVETVAADDDFFRLGGDSILAIRVISKAAEEGFELTPRRLFENPTVARLAAALAEIGTATGTRADGAPDAEAEAGRPIPLTPVQRSFFELDPGEPHHWNLPVLLAARERLDAGHLGRALAALRSRHDALRLVFERLPSAGDGGAGAAAWTQRVLPAAGHGPDAGPEPFSVVDLSALPPAAFRAAVSGRSGAGEAAQASLDLARGPLRALLFRAPPGEADRLLLVVHHLAVDTVSWGILLEELERAYRALAAGGEPRLPPRTLPFARWARRLEERARSPEVEAELALWRTQAAPAAAEVTADLPLDGPGGRDGEDTEGAAETVAAALEPEATDHLLDGALPAYQSRPEELVLTALARAVAEATGRGGLTILLESHGRPDEVDLSRTVGWLTALYPVRLELSAAGAGEPGADVKAVKERLRSLPGRGLGYGLLRHLRPDLAGTGELAVEPLLAFNYLGRLDLAYAGSTLFAPDPAELPGTRSATARRLQPVEINAYVLDGRFHVEWRFGPARIRRATVEALAERHLAELRRLIDHCLDPEAGGFTPSDFPAADLRQEDLDRLVAQIHQTTPATPRSGSSHHPPLPRSLSHPQGGRGTPPPGTGWEP
jgi:amino acid adenylation domain-containing protein/non-ribosomal peptide synthase protein (TIGR01720 family)